MAAKRTSLVERLERSAQHLRLVAEALGHAGGRSVWFVVSTNTQQLFNSPPIGQGTCIAGDTTGTARISAEGLGQIVGESRAAILQARKALGGQPPHGGATARTRGRK